MSFEFSKMEGKPSWTKDGIYLVDTESNTNTLYLNGLDFTNDLERFSLGNWNSIVKNNKIFPSVHKGLTSNMEQGRPVQLQFAPSYVIYSQIPPTLINDGSGTVTGIRTYSFRNINNLWEDDGWPRSLRSTFLKGGEDFEDVYELLNHLKLDFSDGFGYIQERTESDIANNRFRIKLDPDLRAIRERILSTIWQEQDPTTPGYERRFQLYFEGVSSVDISSEWGTSMGNDTITIPEGDRMISIGNPINPDEEHIGAPMLGSYDGGEFITLDMDNEYWEHEDRREIGEGLGYPNFSPNLIPNTSLTMPEVDFKVMCFGGNNPDEYISRDLVDNALNQNALLYYDKEDDRFVETSYPLKVYLGVDVFDVDNFTNEKEEFTEEERWSVIELIYNPEAEADEVLTNISLSVYNNVFYYEVIQWGDEDVLLSNDDILNSEYFS